MRKLSFIVLIVFVAVPALAQQINVQSIDKLASKAKEKTEVSLDESTLKFASGFLSSKNVDEASAKRITEGIKGITVRSYEFEHAGAFSQADLQPIRDQLKTPQWSRIVNVHEGDNEDTEIWIHRAGTTTDGMLILSTESNELTIVNIVGKIEPQDLGILGGQFGIPKIGNSKKD